MGLVDEYCETVYKQTGMRAVYPPNRPVALGDYGTLEDGVFSRLGNVASFGVTFDEKPASPPMSREFKSKRVSKAVLDAGVTLREGVVVAAPSVELGFDADFSVYVAVAGCALREIDDVRVLGEALMTAADGGRWDADWAVVTSLIESSNTTVIVAQERGSRMVLSAKAETKHIDMADANLSLKVTFDSSSSEAWVTEKVARGGAKLTPFFWLHRIKTSFFGGNRRMAALAGATPRVIGHQPLAGPPVRGAAPSEPAAPPAGAAGGEAKGELVSVGRAFDPFDGWR